MNIDKDNFPIILALIITLGFLMMVYLVAFHDISGSSHDLLVSMVSFLGGSFTTIVGFYFGSSSGSAHKTEIIDKIVKKEE